MSDLTQIKTRERSAILRSLAAGVVPKIGLHWIQVGRKRELEALIADLMLIEDGGAAVRFAVGPFGSGKTFFLNLVRTVAIERKFVVLNADMTLDRRLYSTGGHARALYTELIQNMSTRTRPEGGAMPGLVERFVADLARGDSAALKSTAMEEEISSRLRPLLELTHGSNFVRVLARYVEGFCTHNDPLTQAAIRWLRAEYSTKTEAREDLGVRDIIQDSQLFDMLRVWGKFVSIAGYSGLLVNLDEMVVLSERLNNSASREKNYEVLLQILNACLQGNISNIGFCFAGTDSFLSDRRRGLFSYEALATRLADNTFALDGCTDMNSPVIRLEPLVLEDLYVLLERISVIHGANQTRGTLIGHDGIVSFMTYCERRLGAQHFLTPRDTVKQFVGLLNVMEQNPNVSLGNLLGDDAVDETSTSGGDDSPLNEPGEDGLTRFRL